MIDLIPEPHATYVRRVCDLVADHKTSFRDRIASGADLSSAYVTRLVEDPSIICVTGERGSGKSTVLAAAATRLTASGHVVLPPVRPEYFAEPGSLLPTVVAHLKTTIRTDWLDDPSAETDPDLALNITAAIDRALRQANLISFESSESSALRADEHAADRSLAASADSDFIDDWQRLIDQVRRMAAERRRSSATPLIVIPVDDPDLAPGMLRQILLDLRLLTSVDGVVGIACLDLDEARFALEDAYLGSYRSTPSRRLTARVVEAQIAKAFPDDRRVAIEGLGDSEKLEFTALDLPLPSLEDLCRSFVFGETGNGSVASLFRYPTSNQPSPYIDALPANPRDLRGLAYRLSQISPRPGNGSGGSTAAAAMEICKTAVANGLKQSGATDPSLWTEGLPFEVTSKQDDRLSCTLRFDNVSMFGLSGSHRSIMGRGDDDGTIVTLGYESGVESQLVERGSDTKTIQRLDPSLTYALLLVREFSHYYDAFHCNISGPPPIRGGTRRSAYFMVTLGGERADDRFLNAPAWEAYFDYFLLSSSLSHLVPEAASPHELADPRLAIEAFVVDFCRIIVDIQSDRRAADDPARVTRTVRRLRDEQARSSIQAALRELFGEIDRCLSRPYPESQSVRREDFRRWVEVQLANVCHPAIVSPEFIEVMLDERQNLLEKHRRLSAGNVDLLEILEQRIKAALDEPWVQELIHLVGRFDPRLGASLLASHRSAVATVRRGRERLLGSYAVESADVEGEPSDLLRADEAFEVAMSALDELEAEARARMRPQDG